MSMKRPNHDLPIRDGRHRDSGTSQGPESLTEAHLERVSKLVWKPECQSVMMKPCKSVKHFRTCRNGPLLAPIKPAGSYFLDSPSDMV